MDTYFQELKIPKERVAILIGKNGKIKSTIEKATKTKFKIDSKEGDVVIEGTDGIGLFSAKEITRAIGRGFNPDIAMQLLKQDYTLEVISITDYAGSSKTSLQRLKGRVIGSDGKARSLIERYAETNISVYGKTIGIIGENMAVSTTRKAIESLLTGSRHSNVYRWLEKKRREVKRFDAIGF